MSLQIFATFGKKVGGFVFTCVNEIRDAYTGGQEGQLPPLPSSLGR